jgi:hypothetical protein
VNRDALGVLALATLAVLAIAVGAAAIDAPTRAGDSGPITGSGGGIIPGGGQEFDLGQSALDISKTVPFPSAILSALAVAVLVAFLIALYVLRDELGVDELKTVVVLSLVLGTVMTVFYFLLQFLDGSNSRQNGSGAFGEDVPAIPGGGGGGSLESATRSVPTEPPLLALAVAAVLVIGTMAVLRTERTTDDETDDESMRDGPTARVELGRAAGRAADRIAEEPTVENEVYRAWHEMTSQLDMRDPESSTPHEFARAASDAGMAEGDVTELTDLFRTVRYGESQPTSDRESRAVAALRRIEDEYAEEP